MLVLKPELPAPEPELLLQEQQLPALESEFVPPPKLEEESLPGTEPEGEESLSPCGVKEELGLSGQRGEETTSTAAPTITPVPHSGTYTAGHST